MGKVKNPYLRWVISALALGILIFLFPPLYGEGYNFLSPLLNGAETNFSGQTILFFFMVMLLKVFSMTFTNAGGGVGGTFGPTLFIGAIAGFVLASSVNLLMPGSVPVSNFVLVGMGSCLQDERHPF